ncbi:MAG: GntR family transcriptional regulator [Pirellulales bacterium]|nr:GntR family transcriptional regulator [Pirellulales bacterium]
MTNKSVQAYRQIKQLIHEGAVPPGERLTEAKAASLVGMSRGPVRESLVRLEAEGLLENRGSRRSRVVVYFEDQNPEDMLVRYELREQIESGAARLAAKNMTGWQVDRLRELARAVNESQNLGDPENHKEAMSAFRQFILENCGNPLMLEIWQSYNLAPVRTRSPEVESAIVGSIPENENDPSPMEIADAIAAHDADLAEQLLKQRVRRITEAIRKYTWDQKAKQE